MSTDKDLAVAIVPVEAEVVPEAEAEVVPEAEAEVEPEAEAEVVAEAEAEVVPEAEAEVVPEAEAGVQSRSGKKGRIFWMFVCLIACGGGALIYFGRPDPKPSSTTPAYEPLVPELFRK